MHHPLSSPSLLPSPPFPSSIASVTSLPRCTFGVDAGRHWLGAKCPYTPEAPKKMMYTEFISGADKLWITARSMVVSQRTGIGTGDTLPPPIRSESSSKRGPRMPLAAGGRRQGGVGVMFQGGGWCSGPGVNPLTGSRGRSSRPQLRQGGEPGQLLV